MNEQIQRQCQTLLSSLKDPTAVVLTHLRCGVEWSALTDLRQEGGGEGWRLGKCLSINITAGIMQFYLSHRHNTNQITWRGKPLLQLGHTSYSVQAHERGFSRLIKRLWIWFWSASAGWTEMRKLGRDTKHESCKIFLVTLPLSPCCSLSSVIPDLLSRLWTSRSEN